MKSKNENVKDYAAQSKGRVPKLRFPEFRDAGEWEVKRLDKIADTNPSRDKLDDELPVSFVPMNSVSEEGRLINFQVKQYMEVKQGFPFFRDRDLIFAKITPCFENGKAAMLSGLLNGVGFGSTEFHVIRTKPAILPEFLFGFLYSERIRKLGKNQMSGSGGQQRVPVRFFNDLLLPHPNKLEQQKIASCLSSLDTLIAVHGKKLESLKAYKKGLMQRLFPAEGERVPRLRFPGFKGEWEEGKAGKLFANRIEDGTAGLPIYSVTINDGMLKRSMLDRDFYDIEDPEGNKKVCKNDIAYNMMRMWQGALGVAIEDCLVSPAYVILAPSKDVCSDFYFYLLKTSRYLKQLTSHSQGLTLDRLRLYYKDFAQIDLPHPSLPEQQKIAAALSSLDDLIAAQARKLEELKEHKLGLMQGLFPSLNEGA